ncbi:DNA replication complex GINS protein PSF1-like isoform X1 [Pogonomyrmex barbatus]|uniref:DNA replication complex GINS protein PSF1 n=1 Tax=Pogonomyrmex barbatus TaxID=144034 RepID=A0A6I9WV94_9HYME|nr:DNA replication complex GINS protein PSF1-like isoform X1 [Pogonomyrmex barbatus]
MFGKEAIKLVTELDMHEDIRPFNEQVMRQVFEEMQKLYEANLVDSNAIQNEGNTTLLPSVHFRHTALLRNKRCVLAYLYHRIRRLRQMRWELGSILPAEITTNLLNAEIQWFQNYNKSLATYMRSIGDNHGLNLTMNMSPPKTLYVEVKCLSDFGKLELDDGEIITLKKNTYHLLPRAICEPLIRHFNIGDTWQETGALVYTYIIYRHTTIQYLLERLKYGARSSPSLLPSFLKIQFA